MAAWIPNREYGDNTSEDRKATITAIFTMTSDKSGSIPHPN
jgi:hypothetical protein